MPYRFPVKPVPYQEHSVKFPINKTFRIGEAIKQAAEELRALLPEDETARQKVNIRLAKCQRSNRALLLKYELFHGEIEDSSVK